MDEKKITIGNVCFLRDKTRERVLFLKRNREPMKDLCTGVGGKTEFFEDLRTSCIREVQEETGLTPRTLQCKGVMKTILEGKDSSWILFIYVCNQFDGVMTPCEEGELMWVTYDQISSLKLIEFIEVILPKILFEGGFIEGTVHHNLKGHILSHTLCVTQPLDTAQVNNLNSGFIYL